MFLILYYLDIGLVKLHTNLLDLDKALNEETDFIHSRVHTHNSLVDICIICVHPLDIGHNKIRFEVTMEAILF